MHIVFRYSIIVLMLLLQGCYTKLLIPQRTESQPLVTITPQQRIIHEFDVGPFNPDMELIDSQWESHMTVMDFGDAVQRLTFGRDDKLSYFSNVAQRVISSGRYNACVTPKR